MVSRLAQPVHAGAHHDQAYAAAFWWIAAGFAVILLTMLVYDRMRHLK